MNELKTHECWVYDYGCRADMVSKADVDSAVAEKNKKQEFDYERETPKGEWV